MSSFYWFDYETFGTHPAWDRPCQFAGIRTDMELNEVGEPLEIYCRQSMDYLPHPVACKVTGLTPQQANDKGLGEKDFIQRIVEQLGEPGTCSLGYNSIRFDDEFTRHTLFRNFFDAYEHEYKDGNSRWDLLDVVRLTRALRPDGIQWPCNDDGSPSNRLEHLSVANGIEHGQAHDALSDVRATIGLARLIRDKQPRLFRFAFENRGKHAVSRLLNTTQPCVCLQVSGMIPAARSHLSAILPLTLHAHNRNSIIVLDLHQDPTPLLTMNADEIAEQMFKKSNASDDHGKSPEENAHQPGSTQSARPGLRTVQINKCPVIVPLKTLRPEDAERLGIDITQIAKHEQIARALLHPDRLTELVAALSRDWPDEKPDVDGSLYSGAFLSQDDKHRAARLRNSPADSVLEIGAHFDDKRLHELAWRYLARNFQEQLDEEQRVRWQQHCRERLTDETAPWLSFSAFDRAIAVMISDDGENALTRALSDYAAMLREHAGVAVC